VKKTVHDPVHGSITVHGAVLDLLDTVEVQRLRGIKQLGLANVAFPGANHSRFEHALGASHMAEKVSTILKLSKDERELLKVTALLHDVGHAPYSHTFEQLMLDVLGLDHMEITGKILEGKISVESSRKLRSLNVPRTCDVLKEWGLSAKEISLLLLGKHEKEYLGDLLHSEIDVDQLDYLLRDSHYTGVALGMVDAERIVNTLVVRQNKLCVLEKGIEAIEGLLTARSLMYSSVYYHHTVRTAEVMLANAVDFVIRGVSKREALRLFTMNDAQLMVFLDSVGGFVSELVTRLRYRTLFKPVYVRPRTKLSEEEKKEYLEKFGRWSKIRKIQEEIAEEAGVEVGRVMIDVPVVDIIISEPRISKVEMPVLSRGKLHNLAELSPLAEAIKQRQSPKFFLRVLADPRFEEQVERAAKRIFD